MPWGLAVTHPQQEKRACDELHNQGIETYLPRWRKHLIRQGRKHIALMPLFPRYIFVHILPETRWRSVNGTRGIVRLVCWGETPARLPENAITAIKARERDGAIDLDGPDVPRWLPGDEVLIADGQFSGLEAVVVRHMPENDRIVVLLTMLRRQVKVQLPTDALADRVKVA